MSNLITTLLTASLASGFTLQPTSPSGPRGLTSAQLASSGSVMEPLPLLPATKQYRGATVRANTDQVGLVSQHPLHICICKMGLRRSVGTLDLSEFHTTFLSFSVFLPFLYRVKNRIVKCAKRFLKELLKSNTFFIP